MTAPSARRRSLTGLLVGVLAGAVVLGFAVRYRGCGQISTAQTLARTLPRDAELIVLVPDLGALGDGLVRLQQLKLASFAAQLQGARDAPDALGTTMQQLGVDLRSRESLKRAGLSATRGAAGVWLRGDVFYAVVGVDDEGALREAISRLARDRLGAAAQPERGTPGQTRLTFSRRPDGPAELSVVFKDGFALLAPGAAGAQLASSWPPAQGQALSTDPDYVQRLARQPKDRQVLVRVPAGSSFSRPSGTRGALLSLFIGRDAIWVFGSAGLISALESSPLLRVAEDPAPVLPLAAPDAFLVMRSLGAPSALSDLWPHLAPQMVQAAAKEAGFDVQRELFDNLKPGSVASVSLAPTVSLATGVPELDVRRTNPFGYLHLVIAAQVKDAQRAEKALQAAPAMALRFGAQLTPAERGGQRVYLTRYSQGEGAHLALVGSTAIMAAPLTRLDATLARAKASAAPEGLAADPLARPLFEGKPFAAVVDLKRLGDAVRGLPSAAWGIGGFAIRATALRWLDAVDELGSVAFWAEAPGSDLQAELKLQLVTAEKRP